jgi:hypothetical protein
MKTANNSPVFFVTTLEGTTMVSKQILDREKGQKTWRRTVVEVTELTTKTYAVFKEKIIVDNLLATCFALSWMITKKINYTKIRVSPTNSVFVGSNSVINREIHCTAQRCMLRLFLRSSYSLIPHFNVLGCKTLTYICTYIWSTYTVLATCTTRLTVNISAFLPHSLCMRST